MTLQLDTASKIFVSVMAFILGAVMGSFLECLADRGEKKISIVKKERSFCPACGHTLRVPDLVPIASYIFLKGKCRYCKAKIPARHLIIESIAAVAYLVLFLRFGFSLSCLRAIVLISVLIPASIRDYDTGEIPDGFWITAAAFWVVTLIFEEERISALIAAALGGILVPGVVLGISLIMDAVLKKDTLGGADIKLMFATGLYLGLGKSILSIILTCFVGLVFAYIMNKKSKEAFPLAPAIGMAVFITLMAGDPFVEWYRGLLGI